MAILHRDLTGDLKTDMNDEFCIADSEICERLESAILKGFEFEGSHHAIFHITGLHHEVRVLQGIRKETPEPYEGFVPFSEIPDLPVSEQKPQFVRFISGKDNRDYCELIEVLENDGWHAHGEPSFINHAWHPWIVRLMKKEISGAYPGFIKFGDIPSRDDLTTQNYLNKFGFSLYGYRNG